jgi:N-acetyl-alpha-D-muramate 1-phosphate uridylyltransferase
VDGVKPNLALLADAFDPARMDALLLLAPITSTVGYNGSGDFTMAPDGVLARRSEREIAPFVYAGAAILTPDFFAGVPHGPSSMAPLFDRTAQARRLFGVRLEGLWMHVGTPQAVKAAEAAILASVA